ncbi:four helix bundle protein [Thermoanaerobacterium sp. RBIITD]|uniref:four helix bundle protein n=1 Tax=Thermoanaerobacterium sp. RBIITD TaxID=1550240 RepID=UPI000BB93A0C|nr:four helix bundle protein [Thermoanaerobacterium sp. RBIITD]SNX54444.1 four helix bundle protein [Thermoanaerobacterium sp. RBIITD]
MEQNFYIRDFKSLKVWQKSAELTNEIYKITKKFPKFETHIIVSQLLRACTSICANIAEDNSQLYKSRQFYHYNLSLGSAGETRNFLAIALINEYITKEEYDVLELRLIGIIKMLHGCIKKLQSESGSELNDASMV